MPGPAFVSEEKYPKVPEKAPGRLYMVGEVGKMKYVSRANEDGWYARFDAATGSFNQLNGKFSEFTTKYPYNAAPTSTRSREAKNNSCGVTRRTVGGTENEKTITEEESNSPMDGLDLSSLQSSSLRDKTCCERLSIGRIRTDLVELAWKKNSLSKQLQIVDAALENEQQKYLANYALSPHGLMAARRFPAQKKVMQSKRKKTFYRTPGGQVIHYPDGVPDHVA